MTTGKDTNVPRDSISDRLNMIIPSEMVFNSSSEEFDTLCTTAHISSIVFAPDAETPDRQYRNPAPKFQLEIQSFTILHCTRHKILHVCQRTLSKSHCRYIQTPCSNRLEMPVGKIRGVTLMCNAKMVHHDITSQQTGSLVCIRVPSHQIDYGPQLPEFWTW